MYNRFDKGMHPKQSILDHVLALISQKSDGEGKVIELQNVRKRKKQQSMTVAAGHKGLTQTQTLTA